MFVDEGEKDVDGFVTRMSECMPVLSGRGRLVFMCYAEKAGTFVHWMPAARPMADYPPIPMSDYVWIASHEMS